MECLGVFALTALVCQQYNKNMTVCLLAAIFAANVVFGCGRIKENFTEGAGHEAEKKDMADAASDAAGQAAHDATMDATGDKDAAEDAAVTDSRPATADPATAAASRFVGSDVVRGTHAAREAPAPVPQELRRDARAGELDGARVHRVRFRR